MARIFWVFLAAMLAVWAAMNLGTAPRIEALAEGSGCLICALPAMGLMRRGARRQVCPPPR